MTKDQIIQALSGYATDGVVKTGNAESLQRRIVALAEIEEAAQTARERLEAALDDRDTTNS